MELVATKMAKPTKQPPAEVSDQSDDETSTSSVRPQTTALYMRGVRRRREDAKLRTISPEKVFIVDNENDPRAFRLLDHARRVIQDVKNICENSSFIFTTLPIAQLDLQLDWTNLKILFIDQIETKRLFQLLQEASNLKELRINFLQTSSKKTEIRLANLQIFQAGSLEGRGKIRLMTPELTKFIFKNKPDRPFSEAIELAFPEKLRNLLIEEYEPSMQRFKNLKRLACDAGLPDDLLTTFTKLKRLDYPFSYGDKNQCSSDEFSPRKEKILSILREKKRLKRSELEIVFYGVQLEEEQQIGSDLDFTEFLMENYTQLPEDLTKTIHTIDYTTLIYYLALISAELPEDFHSKFRFIEEVKVRDAVDDPEQLLQFLAAFENPFSLDLTDASLDSTFYRQLARMAKVKELEIFFLEEQVDLDKIENFRFLLKFDDLKGFTTNLELSLKTIETLLTKFTQKFTIMCPFNQQILYGRRMGGRFLLEHGENEVKEINSLQALIGELAELLFQPRD